MLLKIEYDPVNFLWILPKLSKEAFRRMAFGESKMIKEKLAAELELENHCWTIAGEPAINQW